MRHILAAFSMLTLACETQTSVADSASGEYPVINSNDGQAYTRYCHDAAGCGYAAVRLLEQFVGSEEPAKAGIAIPFRCLGHDGELGSRCQDLSEHVDAYVRACVQDGRDSWSCEFGVGTHTSGTGDQPLGTVHMLTPTFRYDFWDGARGVGDTITHTFTYDVGTKRTYLPTRF